MVAATQHLARLIKLQCKPQCNTKQAAQLVALRSFKTNKKVNPKVE